MSKFTSVVLLAPFLCSCAGPSQATGPPADLNILSRADWGANPPLAAMKWHEPLRITIHHTATLQKLERPLKEKMRALQMFSQKPGTLGHGRPKPAWPDVPYHFYIDCHGAVAEGRDVKAVGDTNTEYDPTGHVLVVLEGNFEQEKVTDAQWATLRKLVSWLAARYRVLPANVQGHKDYAQTLCPGKDLQRCLAELRQVLEAE